MKFWIESVGKKWMYTEKLLHHLILKNGHKYELNVDSIILVSVCDVTEIFALENIRKKYPHHTIISGGHFAKIGLIPMSFFSDYVWVGHSFDLFKHEYLSDIVTQDCVYYQGREQVSANYQIDWGMCPAIQTDKKRFYIWGGVGCKNKCSFCLTSWTEPYLERPGSKDLCRRVKAKIGKKGSVKIISNAYSTTLGDDHVQDMTLKDMLKIRHNEKRKMIRVGLEFGTEKTRKQNSKPIKDEELRLAIIKARQLNLDLQIFCIGGLDSRADWEKLVDVIPADDAMKPRVFFKWTNLEYQQKTPLFKKVRDINPDNYLDKTFTDWFFRKACYKNKRVRVMPVKFPAHAIWRTCISNVQNVDQYNECKKLKNSKSIKDALKLFGRIKPWKNDLSFAKTYYEKAPTRTAGA